MDDEQTIQVDERWAREDKITLQRYQFERAVLNLNRIEALALIRAAYDCNLSDAKSILDMIKFKSNW